MCVDPIVICTFLQSVLALRQQVTAAEAGEKTRVENLRKVKEIDDKLQAEGCVASSVKWFWVVLDLEAGP